METTKERIARKGREKTEEFAFMSEVTRKTEHLAPQKIEDTIIPQKIEDTIIPQKIEDTIIPQKIEEKLTTPSNSLYLIAQREKKSNDIVNIFLNGKEAAEKTSINYRIIYDTLKGKQKSAGGFKWEKIKIDTNEIINIINK